MTVRLNPYLNFDGNAREAMTFYKSVLGGELNLSTFGEFGMSNDPADQEKLMHSHLMTPDGFSLMGADVPKGMDFSGQSGVTVSLSGDEETKLRGWWEGLSEGGTVLMPLEVAPWGSLFGMLVDSFGTSWMVNSGEE